MRVKVADQDYQQTYYESEDKNMKHDNTEVITNVNRLIDEVEQICNAKKTELDNRIALLEGCIEKAQEEHDEAEAEATKAVDALQIDIFHNAQKRAIAASEEISLCKAKIEELKKTPLISKEQYRQYVGDIDAGLDLMNKTEGARLIEIINAELIPVSDSISDTIVRANRLYESMIRDMLQIEDITKPAYHSVKHSYNDFGVFHMVNGIKNSDFYKRSSTKTEDEDANTMSSWS